MRDGTTHALNNRPVGEAIFDGGEWSTLALELALSPREHEIVRGIFDDLTEASIGRRLGISGHTVHTYIERIYGKLTVHSRVELMIRVFQTHRETAARASSNGSDR